MAGSTRIKVSRGVLIEKMEARKVELEAEHALKQKDYERDFTSFVKQLRKAVADYLASLDTTPEVAIEAVENVYRGQTEVSIRLAPGTHVPAKPDLKLGKIEWSIGVLKAAADEFIPVSTDDEYAQYL